MLVISELLSLQLDVVHRSHNIADIERIKEGSNFSISCERYRIIKTEGLCSCGLGSSHVWSLGYTQTFKTSSKDLNLWHHCWRQSRYDVGEPKRRKISAVLGVYI